VWGGKPPLSEMEANVPETVRTDRDWGTIQPDTRYDLGHVDVRFEVPLGISYEMMEVLAAPEMQKAIDQFERMGDGKGHKWKHYDKIPIEYHVSTVPTKEHLDYFNKMGNPDEAIRDGRKDFLAVAADDLKGSMVAMVGRIWFIRPLVAVNMDEEREWKESLDESMGYVPIDEVKQMIQENTIE
jgi:hypothetical protein